MQQDDAKLMDTGTTAFPTSVIVRVSKLATWRTRGCLRWDLTERGKICRVAIKCPFACILKGPFLSR
jgi:hypothetical protein